MQTKGKSFERDSKQKSSLVYTHAKRSHTRVIERVVHDSQSSVGYGNMTIAQHALKVISVHSVEAGQNTDEETSLFVRYLCIYVISRDDCALAGLCIDFVDFVAFVLCASGRC